GPGGEVIRQIPGRRPLQRRIPRGSGGKVGVAVLVADVVLSPQRRDRRSEGDSGDEPQQQRRQEPHPCSVLTYLASRRGRASAILVSSLFIMPSDLNELL